VFGKLLEVLEEGVKVKLHFNAVEIFQEMELYGQRLMNCTLWRENQREKFGTETYYPLDLDLFCDLGNIYPGEAIEIIEKVAKSLRDNSFTFKVGTAEYTTSLIYDFLIDKNLRKVTINWNKNFIPLISGEMLPGEFLLPHLRMCGIQSGKRYGLYLEIEKHLWKLGTDKFFTLTKEQIRNALDLEEGEYPEFKIITSRYIKPLMNEIYSGLGIRLSAKPRKGLLLFSRKSKFYE